MSTVIIPERPVALEVLADGIPAELVQHDHFVVWRYKPLFDKKSGQFVKWDKPPISARNLGPGSSTNPRTWTSFTRALAVYQAPRDEAEVLNGIGFVLMKEIGITFVDLDHCLADGVLHPAAAEIVAKLASYTELSPSGDGVHVFVQGRLPAGSRNKTGGAPWGGAFEVYDNGRYATVTGQPVVLP